MNIFKSIWKSIKPAALRFPGVFALSLAAATFLTLEISTYHIFSTRGLSYDSFAYKEIRASANAFSDTMTALLKASVWAMLLAFAAGLFFAVRKKSGEGAGQKTHRILSIAAQILCVALAVPAYFLFKTDLAYTNLALYGTSVAFMAVSTFLLSFLQDEKKFVPNILLSGMIAGISSGCVCTGLFIIKFAVSSLLVEIDGSLDAILSNSILSFSWVMFLSDMFVSYVSKPSETISSPKAFKVIFLYILLPLYSALLLVLYLYLAKSLVTRTLPNGQINWFVSFATALYLLFYFSIKQYENAFTKFFTKWGAVVLYPLIAVQCIAFTIRINAYGYTPVRYTSLVYIIFSVISCILPLVKDGRFMRFVCPLLAFFALFVSITPMNAIDVPVRNQISRIEKLYASKGLFSDGKVLSQNAESVFSDEEKARICSMHDEIRWSESKAKRPEWWENGWKWKPEETKNPKIEKNREDSDESKNPYDFEGVFGFAYSKTYGKNDGKEYFGFSIRVPDYAPINIEGFSTLQAITDSKGFDKGGSQEFKIYSGGEIDITSEIKSRIEKISDKEYNDWSRLGRESQPLIIKTGTETVILTDVDVRINIDSDGKKQMGQFFARGYVCR